MDLNEDTLAFLRERADFRLALRDALLKVQGEDEDENDDDDILPPGTAIITTNGLVDDCDVPGRTDSVDGEEGCDELLRLLNALTPIETLRDPSGWPNADNLYAAVSEFVESTGQRQTLLPEHTAANFAMLQRQVTLLESYRKMLLHKKQNACHFLLSWCEVMKSEPQLLNELVGALRGYPIGRYAADNPDLVEEYGGG